MFTGIAYGTAIVSFVGEHATGRRIRLDMQDLLRNPIVHGNSIMINGACLSVVDFQGTTVEFDLIPETLQLTNLSLLAVGDRVNVEQPLGFGEEMGGHNIQGHVECQGRIAAIESSGLDYRVQIDISSTPAIHPDIVPKGYIAVDGISLTVTKWDLGAGIFEVALIPDTLAKTTLGFKRSGASVNIETDIMIRALNRVAFAMFETINARLEALETKLRQT